MPHTLRIRRDVGDGVLGDLHCRVYHRTMKGNILISVIISALVAALISYGLFVLMIEMVVAYRAADYAKVIYCFIKYLLFCVFLYYVPLPGDNSESEE